MRYIDELTAQQQFNEFLDEQGTIKIGYLQFSPSRILKELDPIAYRCGFADWLDACDLTIDESDADE